jgi:hypothetical protein
MIRAQSASRSELSFVHLPFHLSTAHLCPFVINMKPTVVEDEFEDAEEENKFINEVCVLDKPL